RGLLEDRLQEPAGAPRVRHGPRQDDPPSHQRRVGSSAARDLAGDSPRAHARPAALLGDGRLVMMQVILTQDIENLGKAGEVVSVRPGYGRNYLVPRGFAVTATVPNKNRLEHERAVIARKVEKERATANELANRINGMTLQFERMVGEDEKLFGSVTSRDIAEQLKKANVEIDHRWVQLEQPVKALGKYEVPIRLAAGIVAQLKFWVVGKDK